MNYYLGLDLRTGSIKTILFDVNGKEIAIQEMTYPLYQPHNGWSEQEPEDWYQAAVKTVRRVMEISGVAPEQVKGLGISGQMMGAVMLDEDGNVLRRAILRNDGRTSAAKIQWVKERLTHNYATEVSDASATKLLDVPNRCFAGNHRLRLARSRARNGNHRELCSGRRRE